MNLSLHKELYFVEWERKEKLERSATLPTALLSALVGGLLFLFKGFPYTDNFWTILFLVAAGASSLSLMAGIFFLVNSLFGNWYEQLPSSDKLQSYFEKLKEYHKSCESSEELAQKDFDEYLQTRLAEATAANRANNIRTGGALHKTTGAIILAVIFAGVAVVPYVVESIRSNGNEASIQSNRHCRFGGVYVG